MPAGVVIHKDPAIDFFENGQRHQSTVQNIPPVDIGAFPTLLVHRCHCCSFRIPFHMLPNMWLSQTRIQISDGWLVCAHPCFSCMCGMCSGRQAGKNAGRYGCTYIHPSIHTCIHTYVRMYIYIYIYMYMYTHIHTSYTHIQTPTQVHPLQSLHALHGLHALHTSHDLQTLHHIPFLTVRWSALHYTALRYATSTSICASTLTCMHTNRRTMHTSMHTCGHLCMVASVRLCIHPSIHACMHPSSHI